jgi:hypothetical protein
MQEYKRRQFRGHPLSLAGKSLRTEGFRGVLASRAQLGLGDQLRFENDVATIPFESEIRDSRMSRLIRYSVEFCSGLVDLLAGVCDDLGGGHHFALVCERFISVVTERIA